MNFPSLIKIIWITGLDLDLTTFSEISLFSCTPEELIVYDLILKRIPYRFIKNLPARMGHNIPLLLNITGASYLVKSTPIQLDKCLVMRYILFVL